MARAQSRTRASSTTETIDRPAFLRELPGKTLRGLADQLNSGDGKTVTVAATEVKVNLTDEDRAEIDLGKKGGTVLADTRAVIALGDFLKVPTPYIKRINKQDPELTQTTLRRLLTKTGDSALSVQLREGRIERITEAGKRHIQPFEIVEKTANVLDWDAELARLVNEPHEFSFDVMVPDGFDRGIGGDKNVTLLDPGTESRPERKQVGDITKGGVRVGFDIKHNLAPFAQPWWMRLWCTNGMESRDDGLKIDARGLDVDDVLAEFENVCARAFNRVEEEIKHYYDLRSIKVENPERELRRIAIEGDLSDRALVALVNLAPSTALPDSPTMFDVVNLVTNLANSPSVRRDGGRQLLESVGGGVINDHAARCGHCKHVTLN